MPAKLGNADRVLAIMKKGQRCSCLIAGKRLGLSLRQYQRSIAVLKDRGYVIDADLKMVVGKDKNGASVRKWIAVHQVVRNA